MSTNTDLTRFDAASSAVLRDMLFGDRLEKRAKWEKLISENPIFTPRHVIGFDDLRELAYQRIKAVADAKLFSIFDFERDPVNLFTAHEMLAQVCGSLSTKFTVQFNLFGGTLMALHTDRHLPFMRQVDSLQNMGCFCFTELGYGNNAPKMETTAIFDKSTDEFIINSPTTASQKYWITNGACHANYAIVFAQTIVEGKNEGVNSFIVRIRGDDMKPMPNVSIEDMGHKMGLNGVDNGRLYFNNVRIPREAMLNKMNDVTKDGKFVSDIKKKSARFFKVADRLLSGRLCIASMTMSNCRKGCEIAIRYSQQRLAVGASGESDTPIMTYQLQQNALLPLLARTIVLNFGHNAAKQLFAHQDGRKHAVIKTMCVVKAMISWHAEVLSRITRERCGGASYLYVNQICEGVSGSHSGATAEGDNKVLMQKVVKDILTHERKGKHDAFKVEKDQIQAISQRSDVSDFDTLKTLIFLRESQEVKSIGKMLQKQVFEEGKPFYDVWMHHSNEQIQSTATAFGERYFLQAALQGLESCQHAGAKNLLRQVIYLHMYMNIHDNLSYYILNGFVSKDAAQTILDKKDQAVKDFSPYTNDAVEAMGNLKIPNIFAPIARDYVKFNAQDNLDDLTTAGDLFDFQKGASQASQKIARL